MDINCVSGLSSLQLQDDVSDSATIQVEGYHAWPIKRLKGCNFPGSLWKENPMGSYSRQNAYKLGAPPVTEQADRLIEPVDLLLHELDCSSS